MGVIYHARLGNLVARTNRKKRNDWKRARYTFLCHNIFFSVQPFVFFFFNLIFFYSLLCLFIFSLLSFLSFPSLSFLPSFLPSNIIYISPFLILNSIFFTSLLHFLTSLATFIRPTVFLWGLDCVHSCLHHLSFSFVTHFLSIYSLLDNLLTDFYLRLRKFSCVFTQMEREKKRLQSFLQVRPFKYLNK